MFGGIEYQTPWQPLRLKLEYEGNDYQQDFAGALAQDSSWNFGAVYQWGNFDFDLNYQRGNTLGFGVHYKMNLHTVSQYKVNIIIYQHRTGTPASKISVIFRH